MKTQNFPQVVAYYIVFTALVFLSIWFCKWGLNLGMPTLLSHAGLGPWHRISWHNAANVTIMLWFIGGALVGLNTTRLALANDLPDK